MKIPYIRIRMKMTRLIVLGLFLLLLPAAALFAESRDEPFTFHSSTSVERVRPGMDFSVLLTFDIAPAHYLYRESLDLKLLEGKWVSVNSWEVTPPGESHIEPFTGKRRLILKEKANLLVNLRTVDAIEAKEVSFTLEVSYQGCSRTICFLPRSEKVSFSLPLVSSEEKGEPEVFELPPEREVSPESVKAPRKAVSGLAELSRITSPEEFLQILQSHTFRWGLLACFILGLVTSLTPCAYPLIGITVAVIAGRPETRSPSRGLAYTSLYVLGLSITFAILGTLIGLLGSKVQIYLQGSWMVLGVAAIFIIIALSMFGLFEIRLPGSWASKMSGKAGKGVLPTFIAGLASGLISTPCVSAFLGGVFLFVAVTASVWKGFWLLFAFGWGMGLLLIGVGTFSGLAKALPKPGGWMKALEHFFGWVLLLAAVFFIKPLIPDVAYRVTIGLLFFFGGIFAGGIGTIPAGAKWLLHVKKGIGILGMIFGAYLLVTALPSGERLLLSKLPERETPANAIIWQSDALKTIERAKREGKPVMIDFWSENCPACEEMEQKVFSDEAVIGESRRFLTVRVDSTRPRRDVLDLNKRYEIFGFPTVVFLDSSGKVSPKVVGFRKTKDFLRVMKSVH